MPLAFFYGSLMSPEVIKTLLGSDAANRPTRYAIVKGYTRYCVQDEVYPAAVAAESEDAFVSGIVMHINDGNEMKVLDQYEGSCYKKMDVVVLANTTAEPLNELVIDESWLPANDGQDSFVQMAAAMYVYTGDLVRLHSPNQWSYVAFRSAHLPHYIDLCDDFVEAVNNNDTEIYISSANARKEL